MLFDYVSLVGGLVVLIIAGDVLVRGSVGIALRMGIPSLIIGLTIVAFGTSAPELFISLKAALAGSGGIAIGNVVGSNIANVLLVLGMPALIAATPCGEDGATKNAVFMVGVSVLFVVLCYIGYIDALAGGMLLGFLALFLIGSAMSARKHRKEAKALSASGAGNDSETDDLLEEVDGVPDTMPIAVVYIVLGMIGLPLGAHFTIEGATSVARAWGVTDAVIALTVIALGTSLPELATTVMAAVRKQGAVAIGNVIGSNIFNLLAIIGVTASIVPISVPKSIMAFDVWVMLACAVLLLVLSACRICLGKKSGFVMVAGYAAYIFAVYSFGKVV